MPLHVVNWDKHDVVKCDERGRATLGTEFAGDRVFVYVCELPNRNVLGDKVLEKEASVLTEMAVWANKEDIDTMYHLMDPETGVIVDKRGNEHQSPYSLDSGAER